MSQIEEPGLYTPARYMAVLSVLDYQEEGSIEDIDFYAQAEISLEPEVDSLENLGLLEEDDGTYYPSHEYREDISEIGEIVQIEENGVWADIELSSDEKTEIAEDRTEIIHWIA